MTGSIGSAVLAIAVFGNLATADVGGFSVGRFGAETGHPASAHPTAIFYNPAGLARSEGASLYIEGLLTSRRARYERPEDAVDQPLEGSDAGPGTPAGALDANAGEARASDLLRTSFFGLGGSPEGKNYGWGLAAYAPLAGGPEWSRNTSYAGSARYPGALDGPQRWHSIRGAFRSMHVTASAAYLVEEADLSLGASLSAIRSELNAIRARTRAGTDDLVGENGEVAEGRSLTEMSSIDLGFRAGLRWDPTEEIALGLSYQSAPGVRDVQLEGRVVQKFGAGERTETDARLAKALPDVIRLGLAYGLPEADAELRAAGDLQRWSRASGPCALRDLEGAECALTPSGAVEDGAVEDVLYHIPREYEDSWGVRGGGSYWPIAEMEVSASLAYQTSAIPDRSLDPSQIDADKYALGLGGRYELPADGSAVSAGLTHTFFASRAIEPREASGPAAAEPPSRNPDPAGDYELSKTTFSLGLEGKF